MDFLVAYVVPGLRAAALVFVAWAIGGWLRGPLNRFLDRHTDPTLRLFLVGAARPVLLALALPAALDAIGIQPASIVALLSTVGLAIALSIRGSLSNVASGAILLATRPFAVGDHVSVAAVSGKVQRLNFLFTILETDEGHRVHIPNDKVLSLPIQRHYSNDRVRSSVTMRVPHGRLSAALLQEMYGDARDVPGVQLDDDAVRPDEVEEHAVRVSVRFWTLAAEAHAARSALFVALHARIGPARPPDPVG